MYVKYLECFYGRKKLNRTHKNYSKRRINYNDLLILDIYECVTFNK